jgi:hypothetical protein
MIRHPLFASIAVALGLASAGASSAASAAILTNGDFETTNIGVSNYYYPGANIYTGGVSVPANYVAVPGWTFTGNAGIINAQGSNAWYGGNSPTGFSGDQYAFVQTAGSFSQTFTVNSASAATISWLSGSRPNFGPYDGTTSYEVLLNNTVIDTISTDSAQNFMTESVSGVNLVAGANTLEFLNLSSSGDHTAFIDAASVSAVPLPGGLSLFGAGLVGLGALGWRKGRRKSA